MPNTKRRSKPTPEEKGGGTTAGLQATQERSVSSLKQDPNITRPEPESDSWGDSKLYDRKPQDQGAFTPGELGEPDQAAEPGADNPQAMQGGQGPLSQDGQGNRQNDEFEELEKIEPDIRLGPKDV